MSDNKTLVERLRTLAPSKPLGREAAERIELLEREVRRLSNAMRRFRKEARQSTGVKA